MSIILYSLASVLLISLMSFIGVLTFSLKAERLRGLLLYLAYAAFGVMNASANYACFGYGRIRMVFLFTLVAFTLYIVWRRRCFPPPAAQPAL